MENRKDDVHFQRKLLIWIVLKVESWKLSVEWICNSFILWKTVFCFTGPLGLTRYANFSNLTLKLPDKHLKNVFMLASHTEKF